jgi:tetratricopeptide (TPR) repeat protein
MRIAHARMAVVLALAVTGRACASELSDALDRAQRAIDQQHYAAAITTLEQVLPQARGNERVLVLLREAYRGEVRNLIGAGDRKAADKYLDRLRLVENVPEQSVAAEPPARPADSSSPARDAGTAGDAVEPAAKSNPGWRPAERRSVAAATAPTRARSDAVQHTPPAHAAATNGPQSKLATNPGADAAARLGDTPTNPKRGTPAGAVEKPNGSAARPQDANADAHDATQARNWVRQADALFLARRYSEAGKLYERAHRAAPDKLDDAQDRRTYCRLVALVDRINQKPTSPADWSGIQTEVRSILDRVPENEYAHSLLRLADEHGGKLAAAPRPKEAVIRANTPDASESKGRNMLAGLAARIGLGRSDVSLSAPPGRRFQSGSWQVLETANFRIHHSDEKMAGKAAAIAERTRTELYRTWFGGDPQSSWQPKCDVFIHPTADAHARVTGQGPASPGHSATGVDRGRILSRRVDLRRDAQDVLDAVMPHEITHIVMADRFSTRALPRWADEGAAVLTEPPEKKQAHLRNLAGMASGGRLFSAKQLMTMGDYPPGPQWGMFYAQSVSLVEFLVERGGPAKFIEFMSRSLQNGYEPELKRCYGLATFADLDAEWSRGRATQLAAATGG